MDGTILVADDDRTIRTVLTQALTRAGCRVHATSSLTQLMRWIEEGRGDVVISDVRMPDGDGLEMLPRIGDLRPGLPVIVISAQNTIMTAIKATEAEAFDYLPKPFDLPDLMKRTARALDQRAAAGRADAGKPTGGGDMPDALPLIGRDASMQQLYRVIAQVMNSDLPVMITGESGTGKSLVARAIHDLSERRDEPFVSVTAADMSEAGGSPRLLARAGRGTLLFEEVAGFDAAMQVRLVQIIDRPGADGPRLMATSQRDPARALASGQLRDDLYYRLDGTKLEMPPLRARVGDIALLAAHFLARDAGSRPARSLAPEALELLRGYPWPGNVRQLEHSIRRLALTAQGDAISRAEAEAVLGPQPGPDPSVTPDERERLADSVSQHLRRYFDLHGEMLPPVGLYDRILHEVELPLIEIALDATGGNQAKCAELLGINRNTLRKKITQLEIRVTRRRKLM